MKKGDRIGDWIIERPLGAGGMGSIYLCRGVLSSKVQAALKVLKANDHLATKERFVREVDTLAKLNHPAIVRVLSGGEDPEKEVLYLFMDYVEGENLETRLKKGPLSAPQTYNLMRQIVSGLAHCHQRGVTHRDIKPANIMICADGSARIVDFGIAASEGGTRLTQEGSVPGTMPYVDPAVFEGGELDPVKGDIYATGLVLWECLTGKHAFPEDAEMSSGQRMADMLRRKMNTEAMDPGPGFPNELRELVRQATHPDPKKRIPSMPAFVESLNRVFAGDDGPDGLVDLKSTFTVDTGDTMFPEGGWGPKKKSKSKTPLIIGLVAVIALVALAVFGVVLLVGGAGAVYYTSFQSAQQATAELQRQQAEQEQLLEDMLNGNEAKQPPEEATPSAPSKGADTPKDVLRPKEPTPAKPMPVAAPESHPVTAPPPPPKPAGKLEGVRIKLLFRYGNAALAKRAKRLLHRAGANVTNEKGSEGGTWEPFWGHVYYFGADMKGEADDAVQMLSHLGYLETKGPSKGDEFDLVIWLQESAP